MGQALRRASNVRKNRSSSIDPPTPVKNESRPSTGTFEPRIVKNIGDRPTSEDPDGTSRSQSDYGLLEERDPTYDAMLSQMVGRIRTKPGGKPEMGETFIVEKYNRPMPKLRTTNAEPNLDEKKATPGTLNISQLKQIFLLHQGKAEDHRGSLDANSIAQKFQVDPSQIEKILKCLSLPPEDDKKEAEDNAR